MKNGRTAMLTRCLADLEWLGSATALMSSAYWRAEGFGCASAPCVGSDKREQVIAPLVEHRLEHTLRPKVGRHFERLHDLALANDPSVTLLASQRALRDGGRTLGELDCLYRRDAQVVHREIAVKFYLAVSDSQAQRDWWGPSKRDRLDLKLERMLSHQLRLSDKAASAWPDDLPRPELSEALLLGALFRRREHTRLPEGSNESVDCGFWCYLSELEDQGHADANWVVLDKPWWLSPQQALSGPFMTRGQIHICLAQRDYPSLVARVDDSAVQRGFVVPDGWWSDDPGPH